MVDARFSEEDRVHCPFYNKIGACRNGDRCNRTHVKPTEGTTLLFPHLYPTCPEAMAIANDEDWDDDTWARSQEHVEHVYDEVWHEFAKFGEVEDLVVLDNVSEHMFGHVYCKFANEESAAKALKGMTNRFYGGKLIQGEYTPVLDFREARCRAFHETRCARGGLCNFMHIKHIPKAVKRRLVREMYEEHPEYTGPLAAQFGAQEPSKKRKRYPGRKRASSVERKAMISLWNRERAGEPLALTMAPHGQ